MKDLRRIVFVARNFAGESLRSARAITELDNVELFGICEQALQTDQFREVIYVADPHDSEQLIEAAKQLQQNTVHLAKSSQPTKLYLNRWRKQSLRSGSQE